MDTWAVSLYWTVSHQGKSSEHSRFYAYSPGNTSCCLWTLHLNRILDFSKSGLQSRSVIAAVVDGVGGRGHDAEVTEESSASVRYSSRSCRIRVILRRRCASRQSVGLNTRPTLRTSPTPFLPQQCPSHASATGAIHTLLYFRTYVRMYIDVHISF
ncbi:hypothetical protein J6590_043611 [Homalodisca vitripennis]|nr:hypothetical protein J6590_043611 [Homalodisca vitripennis]